MPELHECPVEGCDHSPFKTSQALNSHIRNVHPEYEGGGAREVLIVGEDFTTAELVRGKRTDIMKEASYGARDKLALKQFKAIATVNLSPPRVSAFCILTDL